MKADVIAKWFNLENVRRIDQLVQDGIITATKTTERGHEVRRYDPDIVVPEYTKHLKARAVKKGNDESTADINQADLRYKLARAEKIELELAELKNQMHRSEDVETLTTEMILSMRSEVLALPGRVAVDCEMKSASEVSAIVKEAVDELLNDMAEHEYNATDYKRLVAEREKWLNLQEAQEEQKRESTSQSKKPAKSPAAKKPSTKSPAKKPVKKTTVSKSTPAKSSTRSTKTSGRRKT